MYMKRYGINMKEKIIDIKVSNRKEKKYTAFVQNIITRKERKLHFGARNYQQFRDSTSIKKYEKKNHGDKERRRRYFLRHSAKEKKREAVKKELRKSKGLYNAKILSHIYLW
jgi:hypothetical protein